MAILGIDITPDGNFAYIVVEGKTTLEKGIVNPRNLPSLFKKYAIRTLAVDNVSELFQYGRALIKLLSKLPYTVEVIEVTRDKLGFKKMEELVQEYFGVAKSHLTPLETAEYLALLASLGIGTPVKLFEEETIILIYRKISTTPGGMSRNRFMRNITHRIKSIASKIELKLKEAKLDYDLFIKEESGEVTSAKFVVYANKEVVRRYIKPMRSIDVAVTIYSAPAKRGGTPSHERYLILGVDPGVVTGLAILTLDGEVLDTAARRGLSRGDILRYVRQWGIPVLIATDVAEAPEFVKRLAAMSGAVLYTPGKDLSSEEKTEILDKINWRVKSSHERDALVAAYRAYQEYKLKFDKIEKEFGKILNLEQLEYAKALVVRGYSIAQAVSEALKKREEKEVRVVYITAEKPCGRRESALETQIRALEYENQQLRKELETLRQEYTQLRKRLEDEKWRDLRYRELQTRVETLTSELIKKEAELEQLKKVFIEILSNYGSKYKLIHTSETVECKGDEPVGTICRNIESVEEAVARKTLGVPLKQVAKLQLGEFYVIDQDLVKKLVEDIRRKIEERKEIDLRKIVEQYRRGLIQRHFPS